VTLFPLYSPAAEANSVKAPMHHPGDWFHGQFTTPPEPNVPAADTARLNGCVQNGQLRLTLPDLLVLAARNAIGVRLQRLETADRDVQVEQSDADFEPVWIQQVSQGHDRMPSGNYILGLGVSDNTETAYTSTLRKYFPTGTTLWADFSLGRTDSNTLFLLVNPDVTASWSLGFSQHLLKGAGKDVNRAATYIARCQSEAAQHELRRKLEQTLLEAEKLYWDILAQQMDLEVKRTSYQLAIRTAEDVAHQVAEGNQPELNLYKVKAEVARREGEVATAETLLANLKRSLLDFLGTDESSLALHATDMQLLASDPQVTEDPEELEAGINRALAERPEIGAAKAGLAAEEVKLRACRNLLKPTLDLTASYTQYGLKGDVTDMSEIPFPIPPDFEAGIREEFEGGTWGAIGQSFDGKYNGYKVQVSLNIPLGNLDARANAARAAISVEEGKSTLAHVRQTVATQAETARNNVIRDRALIRSAQETLVQTEKDLEGEQAKYDEGVVVIRDLLEAQRNMAAAQSEEVQSRYRFRKSMLDYYRSTGVYLDKKGIKVE